MIEQVFNDQSETADPRIKLVSADPAGLPPATIIAAEIDPLRSEGKLLSDRLEQAGVEVAYHCYEGATHGFFGMGMVVKNAAAAQSRVATALKKALHHSLVDKFRMRSAEGGRDGRSGPEGRR